MRKWDVKFSGEHKSISIYNFLERVEKLMKARNAFYEQLFESSTDLFEERLYFGLGLTVTSLNIGNL